MAEETHNLEKLLGNMDEKQAALLREEFEKVLKQKGMKPLVLKNDNSFGSIRTLEELEKYEQAHIEKIQIPISETSSQIIQPAEPDSQSDELEKWPEVPEQPKMPLEGEILRAQRLQALVDLTQCKDWANSELYKQHVVLGQEEINLDVNSMSSANEENCDLLSFSETEYHTTILFKRLQSIDGQGEDLDKSREGALNDDQ